MQNTERAIYSAASVGQLGGERGRLPLALKVLFARRNAGNFGVNVLILKK
jgi:hypothetical protein